ncbi:unnamed protein product [Owenia fusiformis]|uniref:Cation-transporting ATPase n=1 Tax=Owenia fusiformis TaxID=6347 RepID=A0A8J1UVF1_OWEFU|nr:unnamed protein product [Owenia fusiformis]
MVKSNGQIKEGTGVGIPTMDPSKTYVNPGVEGQMEIYGYRLNKIKRAVTWVFIILTVGFLRLIFYWKPDWYIKCTRDPVSLAQAETVLLLDQYKRWLVSQVRLTTQDGEPFDPRHHTLTSSHYSQTRDTPAASNSQLGEESCLRYFVSKKVKYLWVKNKAAFERQQGLESNHPCSYFHEAKGLSQKDKERRRVSYGFNSIRVHVKPILVLLITEILNPFYVFQLFSVILWYFDEYYYYASAIIVMSAISITATIYQTRTMQRALKETIHSEEIVGVCQGKNDFADVPSDLLVPGDIIEIPRQGCVMQVDAVLITGNCIVNESMLTGESVPVTKTPLPNPQLSTNKEVMFNIKQHSRHVLFCGTKVIQTRYYGSEKVKAVVIRTGFMTSKGELVRSIMYPKPVDFKFTQDSYKFIGVLALISAIGMLYTLIIMVQRGDSAGHVVLRVLDLVTIVVPPALPAAMTIGIVFAQSRLKDRLVYCISPSSINVTGSINVVCFDKTGTLTEDGLDMWGVVPTYGQESNNTFQAPEHDPSLLPKGPLSAAMATCHSLTIIEGVISGDPLDLKMFESTKWDLEEPGEDASKFDVFSPTVVRPKTSDNKRISASFDSPDNIPYEIGIVRQFTFSSSLQRMSVITRTLGSTHFDLYTKGAPEMVASLCRQETVPVDFHDVLMQYTQQGYRVIAVAYKPLPKMSLVKVQRAQREQMENDLIFLGLLVMENRLKQETSPVIRQLRDADLRTIMVTGDNMLTALSVARDCEMIDPNDKVILVTVVPPIGKQNAQIEWTYAEDTKSKVEEIHTKQMETYSLEIEEGNEHFHFAITGKSWGLIRQYYPDIIPKLVVRGTVFARMSPEQKSQLVEALQEVGYYVGMCGDGANDCGALKTAHAGVSLSEAEASVASPFTSKEPNITCIPAVIKEGRAALVTSFGIFKYMATYSLCQFISVLLLYWIGANLTDFQFLYIDLALLTTLSITYGRTGAYPKLVRERPPVSLISTAPIMSLFIQMSAMLAVQVGTWFYVKEQPWFEPFVPNEDDEYASDEENAVFIVSAFQYITLAIIYSKGSPYRKSIFSNYWFLANLIVLTAVTVWLTVYPLQFIIDFMELQPPPSIPFRLILLGIAVANFFICFLLETFLIDTNLIRQKCQNALQRCMNRDDRYHYEAVEEEIAELPQWPPVKSSQSIVDLLRIESSPGVVDVDDISPTTVLTPLSDSTQLISPKSPEPDSGYSGTASLVSPNSGSSNPNAILPDHPVEGNVVPLLSSQEPTDLVDTYPVPIDRTIRNEQLHQMSNLTTHNNVPLLQLGHSATQL